MTKTEHAPPVDMQQDDFKKQATERLARLERDLAYVQQRLREMAGDSK